MFFKRDINAISGLAIALSALLVGCSTGQTPLIIEKSSQEPRTRAQQPIKNSALIAANDPWKTAEKAYQSQGKLKNQLLLSAAAGFLQQNQLTTAHSTLEQVNKTQLNPVESYYWATLWAQYQLSNQSPRAAIQALNNRTKPGAIPALIEQQALKIEATANKQLGRINPAINAHLKLDSLLGTPERNQNQQQLMALLHGLSPAQLNRLSASNQRDLPGWVALVHLKKSNRLDEQSWATWRQQYPGHPAQNHLLANASLGKIPKNIALILPISGRMAHAADAFKNGFLDAKKASGHHNNVRFFDTAGDSSTINTYYQQAVTQGADFVVGPLGKRAVASLDQAGDVPTLVIGQVDGKFQQQAVFGISLSPEHEAKELARKARQLGYRNALVLRKNNAWGERNAKQFEQAFLAQGGKIVGKGRFQAQDHDFSPAIKLLLAINESQIRHQQLSRVAQRPMKFEARARDDADAIVLIGNANDSRKIVPQLKFFQQRRLPVLALSSAYAGAPDPVSDADVAGLKFPDLPWMLRASGQTQQSGQLLRQQQNLPYGGSGLDRLYALGYAAYQVIPELGNLQTNPWQQFHGNTMSLSMDENQDLVRVFQWAEFTENGIKIISNPGQ